MIFSSRLLYCLTIVLLKLTYIYPLYEDQVGKFDWRIENIGTVQNAVFDIAKSSKQLIAASKENVVAGLSMTTGKVLWRHVLEENTELYDIMSPSSSGAVTVSSNKIRRWVSQGGFLAWEITLPEPITRTSYTLSADTGLIVVTPQRVSAYSMKTGTENWSVEAPWQLFDSVLVSHSEDTTYISIRKGDTIQTYLVRDEIIKTISSNLPAAKYSSCSMRGVWLACYNTETKSVDYLKVSDAKSTFTSLPQQPEHTTVPALEFVDDNGLVIRTESGSSYYSITNTGAKHIVTAEGVLAKIESPDSEMILISVQSHSQGSKLEVTGYSLDTGNELTRFKQTIDTSISAQIIKIVPYIYNKVGGDMSYRVFCVFSDLTLAMIQQAGKVMWTREEALSAINSLQMVDLPVSEVEAKMEEEFGSQKTSDIFSQFIGRLVSQVEQVVTFILHAYQKYSTGLRVVMETADHVTMDEDYLTRDEFSLHKMIVAVTDVGKIYGLDSYTGQPVWSRYIPELEPFTGGNRLLLYIQRSTAHLPHQPFATVIAHKSCDGCGSVLYSFNPVTGEPITAPPIRLSYKIDQAMMLPHMRDGDFLKPILLLDTLRQVHVYPEESSIEGDQEMYVFSAQADSGQIVGLRLYGNTLQTMQATPTWSLSLGSPIISLRSKQYREHVHSLGRVLADRNVLYKYVNPNLVAAITESEPGTEHVSLMVYLLDGVTGRIIFSCEHRRSSQPVHMVHSENWLVYTYYNQKARRTEIAVLELYEGSVQSNSTAFSSLHANKSPVVMRQAYILGTKISALSTTLTERGISGKNILMARTVGGVVEVPKAFVDPRRLLEPTPQSKEEGVPPYMPELPLSFEGTVNYNQSVYRVREIGCEPSGLESTSLLVAYGLDVFHTRVAPSKMYDVLKDDFDYLFIGAVTVGMILISFISRHFALKKMVTRAWR